MKRSVLVEAAVILIAFAAFASCPWAQEGGGGEALHVIRSGNTDIVFEPAGTAGLPMDRYQTFEQFARQNPAIADALGNNPRLVNSATFLAENPALRNFLLAHPEIESDFVRNPGNYLDLPLAVSAALAAAASEPPSSTVATALATRVNASPTLGLVARLSPPPSAVGAAAATDMPTVGEPPDSGPLEEAPASTVEIPQAVPPSSSQAGVGEGTSRTATSPIPAVAEYEDGVIQYGHGSGPEPNSPPVHSLEQFLRQADVTLPLGLEVREDTRTLKAGREAPGLLVVDVLPGSPAASAGVQPDLLMPHALLPTIAVAAAFLFPPTGVLMPFVKQFLIDGHSDFIIGIDGSRVKNLLEFEDRLRGLQPSEIVYLSIVRKGQLLQIPVRVSTTAVAGPMP